MVFMGRSVAVDILTVRVTARLSELLSVLNHSHNNWICQISSIFWCRRWKTVKKTSKQTAVQDTFSWWSRWKNDAVETTTEHGKIEELPCCVCKRLHEDRRGSSQINKCSFCWYDWTVTVVIVWSVIMYVWALPFKGSLLEQPRLWKSLDAIACLLNSANPGLWVFNFR